MRECSHCGQRKPLSRFNKNGRGGHRSWCKFCSKMKDRAYLYGMSQEEFEARIAAQLGLCEVCDTPFSEEVTPCVDHDHSCCPGRKGCGRCNRGIVCNRCNKALGLLDDNVETLQRAVEYLSRKDVL